MGHTLEKKHGEGVDTATNFRAPGLRMLLMYIPGNASSCRYIHTFIYIYILHMMYVHTCLFYCIAVYIYIHDSVYL